MGIFTEVRRTLTRLWGRTEQAVGEAYGNEALEYEGTYDETKVDAEEAEAADRGTPDAADGDDDGLAGTAAAPAR